MNNPGYIDGIIDPGYLVWLEEFYPYYYECAMRKEYSVIPGGMYSEYLEEINKKYGAKLYSEKLKKIGAI